MNDTLKRIKNPKSLEWLGKQMRLRREQSGIAQGKVRGFVDCLVEQFAANDCERRRWASHPATSRTYAWIRRLGFAACSDFRLPTPQRAGLRRA